MQSLKIKSFTAEVRGEKLPVSYKDLIIVADAKIDDLTLQIQALKNAGIKEEPTIQEPPIAPDITNI